LEVTIDIWEADKVVGSQSRSLPSGHTWVFGAQHNRNNRGEKQNMEVKKTGKKGEREKNPCVLNHSFVAKRVTKGKKKNGI